MTDSVAAQTPVTEHVGNGVTTSFAYTFTILDSADMVVELDGVVQGSGFTVSGVGVLAGGAVLFSSAPASGVSVLLRRSTDLSRSTAYTYAGDLREDVVDADFNRLWHAMQERAEVEGRSLRAPNGESMTALPRASVRANTMLLFDSDGDPYTAAPASGSAADLALQLDSTEPGKGAAMVGMEGAGAGTVQGWRDSQKVINILDPKYGVVGDRVTDDTAAIQAALNDVPDGGAVYIPKLSASGGVGPSYKVATNSLVLSSNDVTIYGDHRSEYADGFYTTDIGWILKVTGYGCRVQGIAFWGTGSEDVFSTTDAVLFDRRSLGDVEGNSNLDAEVRDCGFIFIRDAITGYGRNVFVFDNLFSNCKRGVVGELHTYNAGANTSDFRGWRISRNRFHGCGSPYIRAGSAETLPATRDLLDSWCIQMPITTSATSHLEIVGNNVDFGGAGFYKGYLAGATLSENITRGSVATFVFAPITDAANQGASSNYVGSISNNTLSARTADAITDRGYLFDTNSIYTFGVSNLTIADNKMHNCLMEHIKAVACARVHVIDNRCSNGNMLWATDATTRPGIVVDQSANAVVMGNRVHSQIGTVYSNGIQCTSTTNVSIGGNVVTNATTPISATATDLAKADSDGLAWQTPTMTNSFTLTAATSKGYRRLFNGCVQISVTVAAGTDNTAAFTLPTGYRPSVAVLVPSVGTFNHAYAQIETSGQVVVNWETTAATSYAINCEFEAA